VSFWSAELLCVEAGSSTRLDGRRPRARLSGRQGAGDRYVRHTIIYGRNPSLKTFDLRFSANSVEKIAARRRTWEVNHDVRPFFTWSASSERARGVAVPSHRRLDADPHKLIAEAD
jgi:hypothetical protein